LLFKSDNYSNIKYIEEILGVKFILITDWLFKAYWFREG
jgi:hypothetical protein